jgi:uncharacterized protein HemX
MNRADENAKLDRADDGLELEPGLREAIGNFRSSVNAWSDAMASRPREATAPVRANWGLVTRWALGCAVFIGTVSGGVYQNHRQQEAAKIEAARIAQQQRELAAQRAQEEADLMAKVDSDIAREVPSALEPMASLMEENQGAGN